MPVSGAAGRSTRSTRAPVCNPTPVVFVAFFSVRCRSMLIPGPVRSCVAIAGASYLVRLLARCFNGLSSILPYLSRPGSHAARQKRKKVRPVLPGSHSVGLLAQECRNLRRVERREVARARRLAALAQHRRLVELVVIRSLGE